VSNLVTRFLTGILFLAVVIGAIVWNAWSFSLVFLAISCLCLWEFLALLEAEKIIVNKVLITVAGGLLFALNSLVAMSKLPYIWLLLVFPLILVLFISAVYDKKEKPFATISYIVFGMIYIVVPLALLNYFPMISGKQLYHWELLLGYFLIIWMYDTAAYVFGISFGRHRLFERISPKKSWEGLIGGALCTFGLAYLLSVLCMHILLTDWLAIALIAVVFGTYGDLFESLYKRGINCKDSGKLLPGHGGVLDRFDSVFLTSPLVFVYFILTHYYF
jgi:phosphatidate cytidylyltransferase